MIGNAIYALLSGYGPLRTFVGGRITANVIPQAQAVPCLYYSTDDVQKLPVRDPLNVEQGILEIGFQTATYAELDTLTSLIKGLLDEYSGVSGGYRLTIGAGKNQPDFYDETLRLHGRAIDFPLIGQPNN